MIILKVFNLTSWDLVLIVGVPALSCIAIAIFVNLFFKLKKNLNGLDSAVEPLIKNLEKINSNLATVNGQTDKIGATLKSIIDLNLNIVDDKSPLIISMNELQDVIKNKLGNYEQLSEAIKKITEELKLPDNRENVISELANLQKALNSFETRIKKLEDSKKSSP